MVSLRQTQHKQRTFTEIPLGVVRKLFKQESQLRGEIVSLITKKLRAFLVFYTDDPAGN